MKVAKSPYPIVPSSFPSILSENVQLAQTNWDRCQWHKRKEMSRFFSSKIIYYKLQGLDLKQTHTHKQREDTAANLWSTHCPSLHPGSTTGHGDKTRAAQWLNCKMRKMKTCQTERSTQSLHTVTEQPQTKNKYSQIQSYHCGFVHRLKGQCEYSLSLN